MKKLGFGCMRLPSIDGEVDIETTKKMVDTFIERGFTYFDTAWMYCGGKSEEIMGEVLVKRYPRESYTLTTKLPSYLLSSEEDRDKVFNEQLRRTGAGFFDYYLIHDVNSGSIVGFEKYNCFQWAKEKKEAGLVRHIGFSFHDGPELLEKVLTEHPEMEFVQLQLNYLDWESSSVQSRKCYEVARRFGKDIIVMEPVRGGQLANVPEEIEKAFKEREPEMSVASWAIRFVAGLDGVVMVLSGMSNMEQLLDNISYMESFKPLCDDQVAMVLKAGDIINGVTAIPCTGCSYCTAVCPAKIPIPDYFTLYNSDVNADKVTGWKSDFGYYETLAEKGARPDECMECGQCESICPQHLEIRELLKTVKNRFE